MIINSDKIERIDIFLSDKFSISRNKIAKYFSENKIKVNDKYIKKNYILNIDDKIFVDDIILYQNLKNNEMLVVEPQNIPLDIIYEDDNLAVINKDRNMPVHIDDNYKNNTLVNALLYHFESLSDANGDFRKGIVHRLDKDTTGAIIITKNNLAYNFIKQQFNEKKIYKEYLAIVHGGFSKKDGTIDLPIGRNPKDRLKMCVNGINSKDAITHYEVIDKNGNLSLVRCIIETGRTHQIRVHMKHINHCIYGDSLYGTVADKKINNIFLHSKKIIFKNLDGNMLNIDASLKEDFIDKIKEIGFNYEI